MVAVFVIATTYARNIEYQSTLVGKIILSSLMKEKSTSVNRNLYNTIDNC